jgi:transposase
VGHSDLLAWAKSRSTVRRFGVECSGTYGAALARYLSSAGEDVREVPASLAHRERKRKPSPGKSDPIDAVAIARVVAREKRLPDIERSQVLTDLRSLSDYLDQLTRLRNQLTNRIHRDLLIWRPGYDAAIPKLVSKKHLRSMLILIEEMARSLWISSAAGWSKSSAWITRSPRSRG